MRTTAVTLAALALGACAPYADERGGPTMHTIAVALTNRPARVKGGWRRAIRIFAAAAALCLASASASAACRTADLAGRWDLFLTGSPGTAASLAWLKCELHLSRGGQIAGRSACLGSDLSTPDISGRITLKRDCRTGGRITIADGPDTEIFQTFAFGDFGVVATLARDKDTLLGVLWDGGADYSLLFQAVKF